MELYSIQEELKHRLLRSEDLRKGINVVFKADSGHGHGDSIHGESTEHVDMCMEHLKTRDTV
jgi:hypothetical protein